MRRRSKEPRRISVVEGRAAAGLARGRSARAVLECVVFVLLKKKKKKQKRFFLSIPSATFISNLFLHELRTIDRPDHKPAWTANRTNRFVGPTFASPCEVGLRPNRSRDS